MATPLAWHNLLHNKVKTSVAIAGVVFAIVLMLMQLGFLEAVKVSATLIYDVLDFDICLRSKDYLNLADTRTFPRVRLTQATNVVGVERAAPLSVQSGAWRNEISNQRLGVLLLGVDPHQPIFLDPHTQKQVTERLDGPKALLVDTQSRAEHGPIDGSRFGEADIGREVELNTGTVTIVGDYTRGAGLTSGAAAIVNEDGFHSVTPMFGEDQVSFGLLKLSPGADAEETAARLRASLPDDVDVLTRDEMLNTEVGYWLYDTNYGLIFQTGVVLSLIVGTAIVYQVLVSDVASLLPEYATLKAMGYSNQFLGKIILQQALMLAIIGFAVVGVALSLILYQVTAIGAQIPVRMTLANLSLVLLLSVLMCTCSGLAALRKAFRADPADLF